MIGKTLGHYRVGEQLGRGGMGEVYVADDLNLNRKVALKFLPDAFTGDPERMARFEREAKLLASLNHPNIAAIYGLEQAEGKRFLVLELVEGETLAQRLSKGALPVEEALGICRQIAEGLEAAHEKGVIHRDLKPANVMITEGDKVKILDFGLAKALSDETQSVDSSQSPTLTEAMTRPGVILGTAAYMSPEQAKGKSVDKRADIWAFGCILYECLTGKRAFEGETVTETLASVLTKELDWDEIPAKIRPLLRRCLEKDTKKRLRDIGEAMVWAESAPESAPVKRSRLAWMLTSAATLLFLVAAVPAFLYFRGREAPVDMVFQISVPPMPANYAIAISPDGRTIAFTASSSGPVPSLFIREMGSVTPRQLEGTEGASSPFWSPDSRSIGFFARGKLKRTEISGGLPRDICATRGLQSGFGGAWNSEGIIIFADWPVLRRISVSGGDPATITTLDKSRQEIVHGHPSFLPDGSHYIYTVISSGGGLNGQICLGSLDSQDKVLLNAGNLLWRAAYVEPGYILFSQNDGLWARPFDANKIALPGEAFRIPAVLASVGSEAWGRASWSATQNGMLIYCSAGALGQAQFIWLDRSGKKLGPAGEPGLFHRNFDLSPDGKFIAVTQNNDIWLMELQRNVLTRLTFNIVANGNVAWSPDGLRIGFTSDRKGSFDIFAKTVGGAGEETLIVESADSKWIKDWSKDGRYITYTSGGSGEADLYAIPLFGDRKPFAVVQSPSSQDMPRLSFDGKWLAYNSNESGTWQVYAVSFPSGYQKCQISTNGGAQPRWRSDGKELYYLSLDGKMMAVEIGGVAKIEPGIPRVLFDTGLNVDPRNDQYDMTSDGRRFLLFKPLEGAAQTPITVVTNWPSLLKK
jgi:eukaryotic-like serine/threonine-protein kinase